MGVNGEIPRNHTKVNLHVKCMYAPLVKQKGKKFFLKVLSSYLVDLWSSRCPASCTVKHWHSCSRTFSRWSKGTVWTGTKTPTSLQSLPTLHLMALSHLVLVTESQNHRITKSQNDLGWKRFPRSSPTFVQSPACHLELSTKCHVQSFIEHLPGWWH